jgi:hypothetical protein
MFLSDNEKAHNLYSEVQTVREHHGFGHQRELLRREFNRLTWSGIWYYGM